MGRHSKQGFTIIETMLVLAITGVLIAGLLVGLGSSISNQRYLDSVSSFKSLIQDQYSQIDNVTNDRDAHWTCDSTATPAPAQNGGTTPGQSDCVLLGRYLSIVDDHITMATVVGYPLTAASSSGTVASIKTDYALGISTSSIQTQGLQWGAQIAWPSSGAGARSPTSPRSLAILLIRSPENGTSYTFTSDTVNDISAVTSATLIAMMVPDINATNPGQAGRTVCLDPNGFGVPEKLAVYIDPAASGPGSIEERSKAVTAAAGGDTAC